jgi:hypothetical protein
MRSLASIVWIGRRKLAGFVAVLLTAAGVLGPVVWAPGQDLESGPTRLIRITTKEVTDPDVAVSFDGKW